MHDLGERPADCGCCTIVDTVALNELKVAVEGCAGPPEQEWAIDPMDADTNGTGVE